jgi:hypothetical protein
MEHDMTDLKVVHLRSTPTLSDIPGQLRDLAAKIEAGEIEADAMLCIIPQDNALPALFLWGENYGPYADIAMLELAKTAIIGRFTST